jgi:hypothetical protein
MIQAAATKSPLEARPCCYRAPQDIWLMYRCTDPPGLNHKMLQPPQQNVALSPRDGFLPQEKCSDPRA